eukprot:Nk52_evm1s2002 gene=Nk52_evmTU1s2002
MPVLKVKVKWGKQKFDEVELNTGEPPIVFKSQLFTLTGVEPERQKVMTKGGVLKDDSDWAKLNIKPGHTFMLMGTPGDKVPDAPTEKTVFMEDMNERQLAMASDLPPGLVNVGNTCYMSASIQCLKAIPELKKEIMKYPINSGGNDDLSHRLTVKSRDLFQLLAMGKGAIQPTQFVNELRISFPQFNQTGPGGMHMQQDAEECYTQLVRTLAQKLPPLEGTEGSSSGGAVKQLMAGEMISTLKCDEAPEEAPKVSKEEFYLLPCHISKDVNHLVQGIKEKMSEQITKHSETLGRDAVYTKTSKLNRLPAFLTINFVRFFWKPQSQVKAKILRNVKYPTLLDVFELCSPELQEKLLPQRKLFEAEEARSSEKAASIDGAKSPPAKRDFSECQSGIVKDNKLNDPGCCDSGYYELTAVLTHIGRSADSGHYVGWVRDKGDDWLKFDDDTVTKVNTEDILKLSGGGDWHIAYLLVYGRKPL